MALVRRYADYAMERLVAYLAANLNTFITAVNTEQSDISLALDTINVFNRGVMPFSVEELPRLDCEHAGTEAEDWKNGTWDVDLIPVIVIGIPDAQILNSQRDLLAYGTAYARCIQDDIHLTVGSDTVIEAEVLSIETSNELAEPGRLIGTVMCPTRVQIHEPWDA